MKIKLISVSSLIYILTIIFLLYQNFQIKNTLNSYVKFTKAYERQSSEFMEVALEFRSMYYESVKSNKKYIAKYDSVCSQSKILKIKNK